MNFTQRPLEFRIWDKKKNCWHDDEKDGYSSDTEWIGLNELIRLIRTGKESARPRFAIQQFTGLLDKNGKKIFEGDVVKLHDSYHHADLKDIIAIEYDSECGGFIPFTYKRDSQYYCGEFESEKTEILGNIFENPDLLK